MARRGKRPAFPLRRLLGGALVVLGVGLLGYAALNSVLYNEALKPDAPAAKIAAAQAQPSKPTHIRVGPIDLPVETHTYTDGNWTVASDVASYLQQSAKPGEPGNIIIYGHNKPHVFGNLPKLKGQEEITLTLENGQTRTYRISSMEELSQERVDVLAPTDEEVLTVYTCTGWLDSMRFVVKAKPVD